MKGSLLYGLVIADIHFCKKDDEGLYARLKKYFIAKIEEEKDDLDYIVIAGDLFDRILKWNEIGSNIVLRFIEELIGLSIKYDFKIRILKGTKTHDFNQLNNFKYLESYSIHLHTIRIFHHAFFLLSNRLVL